MKPVNSIDRSFQNPRNEVVETDVPKSGINLTYRNHLGGLILGRLYPQSIQHTMPNDKISGSNEANLTFERLATPVIDDVDVCVHNFLVTLRSIDKQWEKFMTPTKLNNMNAGVTVPMFDLTRVVRSVLSWLSNGITIRSAISVRVDLRSLFANMTVWDFVYHSDALYDLRDQLFALAGFPPIDSVPDDYPLYHDFDLTDDTDLAAFKTSLYCVFDFFVGKRSLLDYLGYLIISHEQVDIYVDDLAYVLSNYYEQELDSFDWLTNSDQASPSTPDGNFVWDESGEPYQFILQNEYALRAYYAIWFEYYRNYDLEPRSAFLPEYHDFGATSIFGDYPFAYLHYLVPRIRSWQQDAFTTAGIDDISRHVFAPILNSGFDYSKSVDGSLHPSDILDNNVVSQVLKWRNPATNTVSTVTVPVPTRFIDSLRATSSSFSNQPALELFSLRKAQMLENFLKRIYYGGDEYRDRMLHLYGARIEDYRINRPQWLSSSLDMVSPRQEVANTGIAPTNTDPSTMPIGSRVATATGVQGGSDGFTEFCPEFGVYISILSIMPHSTYNPYLMQNLFKSYSDFPIPQFANQMEDVISTLEISRGSTHSSFGYAPYGHAYRYRVDEVHGDYLDEKYDYCFLRFFNQANIPNLSWSFIHCRPKLPMFVNNILLDGQVYGTFKHNFLVERPLPSPVETI